MSVFVEQVTTAPRTLQVFFGRPETVETSQGFDRALIKAYDTYMPRWRLSQTSGQTLDCTTYTTVLACSRNKRCLVDSTTYQFVIYTRSRENRE